MEISRRITNQSVTELIGSLKLVNVLVFVQLIFDTGWPMNQMNKNPNISLT